MNISIEVGHPAHVHYWRPVRQGLLAAGHEVTVFARGKETTFELLRKLKIPFVRAGRNFPTIPGKAVGMCYNTWKILEMSKALGIQAMLSGGMPYSAQASAILGIPHLAIVDTEHARLTLALTMPFTDVVCTPACFKADLAAGRHVRFNGYVESMYLAPAYFKPDPNVLGYLDLKPSEPFSVVRFSSWDSSHDMFGSPTGLKTLTGKYRLVQVLEEFGPVYVTSEVPLPNQLAKYSSPVPIEHIHSLLHFASIYVGEGAKMAAEAGMLGTPWIFLSPIGRCYLDEQQVRFGLGRTVQHLNEALTQARTWLTEETTKSEWQTKRRHLLASTDDVTVSILREVERLATTSRIR